jgi:hypothetical protein
VRTIGDNGPISDVYFSAFVIMMPFDFAFAFFVTVQLLGNSVCVPRLVVFP